MHDRGACTRTWAKRRGCRGAKTSNTGLRWSGDAGVTQFSFRLKRYCSTGSTAYTGAFNGISFPGTEVGNTTYFSLSPSCVRRAIRCAQCSDTVC